MALLVLYAAAVKHKGTDKVCQQQRHDLDNRVSRQIILMREALSNDSAFNFYQISCVCRLDIFEMVCCKVFWGVMNGLSLNTCVFCNLQYNIKYGVLTH